MLAGIFGGVAVLIMFGWVETRVAQPMFRLDLFRIRAFTAGNVAGLLAALGRGGLQFMLIIWLQGIWLPLHGYGFAQTPLWAGIAMIPLTIGFLTAAPRRGAGGPLRCPAVRDRGSDVRGLVLLLSCCPSISPTSGSRCSSS